MQTIISTLKNIVTPSGFREPARAIIASVLSILIVITSASASLSATSVAPISVDDHELASEAADILGINERLAKLSNFEKRGQSWSDDAIDLRLRLYDDILQGIFDVRTACNNIERELVYTYDLMKKQARKQQDVSDVLNLLNFIQFGTLYTLEATSRLHNQFTQSGVLTGVAAGNGIALPTANILYGKVAKTGNVAPPKSYAHIVTGSPVTDICMPETVKKFLDRNPPGQSVSRKELLYRLWKIKFGTDAMARQALCSLVDGKKKSIGDLSSRIVHLWALHTVVENLDSGLLELIKSVTPDKMPASGALTGAPELALGKDGEAAAALLGIKGEVNELAELNKRGDRPDRRKQLELFILGKIIVADLEMRHAVDRVYSELNYSYDVALAELEAKRGKALQRTYDANFIQINSFAAVACLLFLKNYSKAGDELFVIGDSISMALSTLALIEMRGGKRKIDMPPNSLADFFGLKPAEKYKLSPFVTAYLDSPDPKSNDNQTHKQVLTSIWRRNKVCTLDIDQRKNQIRLAAMPEAKVDTIKILRNRVILLNSLRVRLQLFDQELLRVLTATEPSSRIDPALATGGDSLKSASVDAFRTAKLLGVERDANRILELHKTGATPQQFLDLRMRLTRAVLEAKLKVSTTAANIDQEIAFEKTASDRLRRYRDMGIQLTNIANFYQIGILGVLIDGVLGLSNRGNSVLYSNRLNVVSGSLVIGLGGLAFLQKPGGIRLKTPPPNMLGPCLALNSPAKERYAPLLLKYLKAVDPRSPQKLTRAEELLNFWKESGILAVNITKKANQEKVSAVGPHHHWWSERIKIIEDRINMLFDLRSMTTMMEEDISNLLSAVT